MFYKPYDVLSQFTDREASKIDEPDRVVLTPGSDRENEADHHPDLQKLQSRRTLKDYISVPSVYPVGRLDSDSEGLMLLTNNGRLQHRLSDRRFRHPRTYWVQVERIPNEATLNKLRSGVVIQNYRTRPALVQLLSTPPPLPPRQPPIRFRKTVPTSWLELTITEGRNRQVRRMTATVGFPTLRLVRIAIANLHLEGLEPGQWRDLTPKELEVLLSL